MTAPTYDFDGQDVSALLSVSTVGAGAVDVVVLSIPVGSGPFLSAVGQALRVDMSWLGTRSSDGASFTGDMTCIVDPGNGGEQFAGSAVSFGTSSATMFISYNGGTSSWEVKYRNADGGITITHNVAVRVKLRWIG